MTVDGATGLPCTPSDLGCQAGGEGATSCQMSCGGGGLPTPLFGGNVIGQSCGVSCDIARAYYPCCKCGAGGAECRCKSSTQSLDCGDGKGDALTPVEN